jgi:hypothetical protein
MTTSQGGSLSSTTPEKKCRRWQWTRMLLAHYHLLGFFSTMNSLTASPPDASLGILWSHSLHHHLMHLLGGFCDLTHYIITWCIFWDFMISFTTSPPDASLGRILWSHSLHHHLHLLGFYDLVHCITTWCISWEDFVISFIASSLDASHRILWSRSFHHHMMHLLGGFCDLIHCIITWCISWDFMISLTTSPPNASPH